MKNIQTIYLVIKELNEIIKTPPNIFEEDMIKHFQEMYDSNLSIEIPELKTGIDYKMVAIKLCAEKLKNLI